MTAAASRRRGVALLALALLTGLALLGLTPRTGGAQVFCQRADGTFVPCELASTTTVDEPTTTTEDEPTTTEGTVDDETDATQGTDDRGDDEGDDEEVVTASTLTVTTLRNVLVPGDGTEGAESTTTTAKALASGSSGISDETLILLIVGGLGLVSAVVGVLTWRYWGATRPTVAQAAPRSAR